MAKKTKPTGKLFVIRKVCDTDDKLLLAREALILSAVEFGFKYRESGSNLEETITAAKQILIQKEGT